MKKVLLAVIVTGMISVFAGTAQAGNQWHIDNLVDCLAEAAWHESQIDLSEYCEPYEDPEGRDERQANAEFRRTLNQAKAKDRVLCRQIEAALRTAIIKQELISQLENTPWDVK